jgi:peptidoglycan L-alanyl-D-glutamate endopeptidase CwlK
MPRFSSSSLGNLTTCHPYLQLLFNTVIKEYDCKVLEGHRSPERQQELLKQGATKVKFSNHNYKPSLAVDVSPYPIPNKWGEKDFKELAKFYHFAGFVKGVAFKLGIDIRWGGDWDGDKDFNDQSFDDLVHFELLDTKSND